MHPFLHPRQWLVNGRFADPDGPEIMTAGMAIVRASEQSPNLFQVSMELHRVGDSGSEEPQNTYYHLEVVAASQARFRMDSTALGTVLAGGGSFSDRSLTLTYLSPDRRYVGFESFVALTADHLLACGSFVADGALSRTWEVSLQALR